MREGRVIPPSQCRWEALGSALFGHRTQNRRAGSVLGRARGVWVPRRGAPGSGGCRRALPGLQRRSGAAAGGRSRSPRCPPLPAGPRLAPACHSLRVIYSPRPGKVRRALPYLGLNLGRGWARSQCRLPRTAAAGCATQGAGHGSLAKPRCALPAPSDHLKGRGTCPRAFTAKLGRLKGMEAAAVCPCVVVAEGQSCFPQSVTQGVQPLLQGRQCRRWTQLRFLSQRAVNILNKP